MSQKYWLNWRYYVALLAMVICLVGLPTVIAAASARGVTVVDATGKTVKIPAVPNRVVCLSGSISEILATLNVSDKLVGRDKNSIFPPSVAKAPIVADSSYRPNIEVIVEKQPDLIIADTMLQDDARRKFEAFGIPVLQESASDPARSHTLIRNLGLIFAKQAKAEELINFLTNYENMVAARVAKLPDAQKPRVFWDWSEPYKTGVKGTSAHEYIVKAGGINVAANVAGTYPVLSAEWTVKSNPQFIIKMANRDDSEQVMQQLYYEVLSRPALQPVAAIRHKQVYVVKWNIFGGLRSLISIVQFAKWFHPSLFSDLDPVAVHKELLTRFFGVKEFSYDIYPVK